jgi:hypothetical protein
MNAKLHIDLGQGILDVEGEEKFVQAIYEDFKNNLPKQLAIPQRSNDDSRKTADVADSPEERKRRRATRRVATHGENGKTKIGEYVPKLDANLDLKLLDDFYAQFDPKSHREKILIFAMFLRDALHKAPCSADDIFTCYRALKEKTEIPEAFLQAIRDAQNKQGLVEFASPMEIKITIAGENYFNQKLRRKEQVR